MTSIRLLAAVLVSVSVAVGCGGDGGGAPGGPDAGGGIPSFSVSGQVIDFESGAAITGSATISLSGLNPPPTVSVTGAQFTITGIAPFSVFHLLSGSPPDYRNTYNVATTVDDHDVTGVTAQVVKEQFVTAMTTAFAVTPTAGTGIVLAHATDMAGAAKAGVPAAAFALAGGSGPYFLDANKQPAPGVTSTTASGWIVFFNVPAGLASLAAAPGANYAIVAADAPVAAATVTLVDLTVTDGAAMPPPTNVSFSADVIPVFDRRGCANCHSGNGVGRDLGGLTLDGSANLIHRELTEEISPNFGTMRVNLGAPEQSLVLTMPGPESPPDPHPNVTFASAADPDYQIILAWIKEGAPQN